MFCHLSIAVTWQTTGRWLKIVLNSEPLWCILRNSINSKASLPLSPTLYDHYTLLWKHCMYLRKMSPLRLTAFVSKPWFSPEGRNSHAAGHMHWVAITRTFPQDTGYAWCWLASRAQDTGYAWCWLASRAHELVFIESNMSTHGVPT